MKVGVQEPRPSEDGKKKSSILHGSFEIAILLKGLHSALEIVGGALLWFVKPETLNTWIRVLTQHELAEDPGDLIANFLVRSGQHYSLSAQHFGVFYLLSHGAVKIALVLLLWRRKLWAYPAAVVVLALFIGYQVFRWTSTHAVSLLLLSGLDAIVIALTLREHVRLRREARAGARA